MMDLEKTLDVYDKHHTGDNGDELLIVNYTSDITKKTESIQCIIYKDYFLYGEELVETIAEKHCDAGELLLDYVNLDIKALDTLYETMCNIEIGKNFTFKDLILLFPGRSYLDYNDFDELPKKQLKRFLDYNYAKNVYYQISKYFQLLLNTHPFFWDHISQFSTIRYFLCGEIYESEPMSFIFPYTYILMFLHSFKEQIETVKAYNKAVDFILCINTNDNLQCLSFIKRQYLYITINSDLLDDKAVHNFSPKKENNFLIKSNGVTDSFEKNDALDILINNFKLIDINPISYITVSGFFHDVCSESLNLLIKINKGIKRCNYCSKYFFAKGNYESNYCDRIYTGTNRTCQQLASIEKYQDKVKGNAILKEYQKAYKRIYAQRNAKKISEDEYRHWVYDATVKRDEAAELYNSNPDDQIVQEFKKYLGNK